MGIRLHKSPDGNPWYPPYMIVADAGTPKEVLSAMTDFCTETFGRAFEMEGRRALRWFCVGTVFRFVNESDAILVKLRFG